MALHSDLPIYRSGVQLLAMAYKIQEQMPRRIKRSLGDKITQHCVEMLDCMALANATRFDERAMHLEELFKHERAVLALLRVCHESGSEYLSHKLWAQSVLLLANVGKQAGGWMKSASNKAPAA